MRHYKFYEHFPGLRLKQIRPIEKFKLLDLLIWIHPEEPFNTLILVHILKLLTMEKKCEEKAKTFQLLSN